MQLDKTHITIRERGLLEVMDLALQVFRERRAPLLLAIILGSLPFALFNGWLLVGLAGYNLDFDSQFGYIFWMMLLVTLEAPLAAAPTTLYLGQVTFHGSSNVRQILREIIATAPQMFWYQFVVRAACVPMFITLIFPSAVWPYLTEVILLEKNPMFSGKQNRMTTYRRSKMLHFGSAGDLFGYWILTTAVGALLVVVTWTAIWSAGSLLLGGLKSTHISIVIVLPIAIWLVLGYFTVVRFLLYLDLRIRREGWEVELAVRAQARRLAEGAPI